MTQAMRSVTVVLALIVTLPAAAAQNLLTNGGVSGQEGWFSTGGEGVDFDVDRKVGASKKGALRIRKEDGENRSPHNWNQGFDFEAGKYSRFET